MDRLRCAECNRDSAVATGVEGSKRAGIAVWREFRCLTWGCATGGRPFRVYNRLAAAAEAEELALERERCRPPWRPMTAEEMAVARALSRLRLPAGHRHKHFARDLAAQAATAMPQITDRQAAHLNRLRVRYRRQLPPKLRLVLQGGTPYGGRLSVSS